MTGIIEKVNGMDSELLSVLNLALSHANQGVANDNEHNVVTAIDHYDKAILYMDEILVKISRENTLWSKLVQLRDDYDDRMEYLRSDIMEKRSSNSSTHQQFRNTRKKRQSQITFEEDIDLLNVSYTDDDGDIPTNYEEPPRSLIQVPYHQMRVIQKSIEHGAFLTPNLFCPKSVWSQIGVKFSGLSIKTSAFQDCISIIRVNVPSLPDDPKFKSPLNSPIGSISSGIISFVSDVPLLQSLLVGLKTAHEEMITLQNQLSKPFPFIREIVIQPTAETAKNVTKGQVARFATMMSSIGKSVLTMAETQYQRLGTIPVHVTDDDFVAYVALTSHLCEVCQKLDEWRVYIEQEIKQLRPVGPNEADEDEAVKMQQTKEVIVMTDILTSSVDRVNDSGTGSNNEIKSTTTTTAAAADASRLDLLQDVHVALSIIAVFMRDVICEILLQDVVVLTNRYIEKSRKNFSSMMWDDDHPTSADE